MNALTHGELVSEATRLCQVGVGGHRAHPMIGTPCGAPTVLGIAKVRVARNPVAEILPAG